MKIVGSVIARSGSKRLAFKNLLPYKGEPLVRRAIIKLFQSNLFTQIVLSTDCELIARTCLDIKGLSILKRPAELASDRIASVPVFQHILKHFPGDIHLNYNCNFPECPKEVFSQALSIASDCGEALSDPYAVWAQTSDCLKNYGDPFKISAKVFHAPDIHPIDVHTENDLLNAHRENQPGISW